VIPDGESGLLKLRFLNPLLVKSFTAGTSAIFISPLDVVVVVVDDENKIPVWCFLPVLCVRCP
jgi:hypothetical protein